MGPVAPPSVGFSAVQADAIRQATSFRRTDYDRAVRPVPPGDLSAAATILTNFPHRQKPARLGNLPPELMTNVLLCLDLRSLYTFRAVDTNARQAVNALWEYLSVATHAPELLCEMLRPARLAVDFTIRDLASALCAEACEFCGGFAGFMSLIAWKRCCFQCLQTRAETQVHTLCIDWSNPAFTNAVKGWRMMTAHLPAYVYAAVSEMLPGGQGQPSFHLVSSHGNSLPPPVLQFEGPNGMEVVCGDRETSSPFLAARALPHLDRSAGAVDSGVSCAGCHVARDQGLEEHAPAEVHWDWQQHGTMPPWLWGLDFSDVLYSREGFLEHFRRCTYAHTLWESSYGGILDAESILTTWGIYIPMDEV